MMIRIFRACAISITMESLGSPSGASARDTLPRCVPIMAARADLVTPARSMCAMICSIGPIFKHAISLHAGQGFPGFLCALKLVRRPLMASKH